MTLLPGKCINSVQYLSKLLKMVFLWNWTKVFLTCVETQKTPNIQGIFVKKNGGEYINSLPSDYTTSYSIQTVVLAQSRNTDDEAVESLGFSVLYFIFHFFRVFWPHTVSSLTFWSLKRECYLISIYSWEFSFLYLLISSFIPSWSERHWAWFQSSQVC